MDEKVPDPADPHSVLAVRHVLERYFACVDNRDWVGLGECFAVDAQASYGSDPSSTLLGRAAIVERVQVVERFAATLHVLGNADVVVTGACAHSITNAIAHLVTGDIHHGRVLVRGLRYVDALQQVDGRWQIHRRKHLPLWQYEAGTVVPRY